MQAMHVPDYSTNDVYVVVVTDEVTPVEVIIIPPPSESGSHVMVFTDYADTYGPEQLNDETMRRFWAAELVCRRYLHKREDVVSIYERSQTGDGTKNLSVHAIEVEVKS